MHGLSSSTRRERIRPSLICATALAAAGGRRQRETGREAILRYIANPVLTGFTLPKLLWCRAQLNRGAIEGNVADPQGWQCPSGDTITGRTNVVTSTKTKMPLLSGRGLVPGTYRAHFVAKGFTLLDIAAIECLLPNDQVNAKLKVDRPAKEWKLRRFAMLETDASNFSTTLHPTLSRMSLAGRDLAGLTFLLPGVNNVGGPPGSNFGFDSSFGTSRPNSPFGLAIAVNAARVGERVVLDAISICPVSGRTWW